MLLSAPVDYGASKHFARRHLLDSYEIELVECVTPPEMMTGLLAIAVSISFKKSAVYSHYTLGNEQSDDGSSSRMYDKFDVILGLP